MVLRCMWVYPQIWIRYVCCIIVMRCEWQRWEKTIELHQNARWGDDDKKISNMENRKETSWIIRRNKNYYKTNMQILVMIIMESFLRYINEIFGGVDECAAEMCSTSCLIFITIFRCWIYYHHTLTLFFGVCAMHSDWRL